MTAGGSFFIPTFFVHFIISFLEIRFRRWLIPSLYILSLVFAGLSITSYMIADAVPKFYLRFLLVPGPAYVLGVLFFLSCVIFGHYTLYRAYTSSSGLRKNQLGYLFWGSFFGYIGGSANFLLPFNINIPILNPFGTYAVPLYVAATTYAIIRHRLMDISLAVNRGLAYSTLLGIIFIPAYITVIISHQATLYSTPPLLAGTLIFACGIWIALKDPRSTPNITFSLVCLGVCVWLFSSFMVYSTSNFEKAQLWWRINYIGVVYIPAFFYHFCASFLKDQDKKKIIFTNYLISTAFLLFIPTNYLIEQPYSYYWGYYPKAGILHPIFLVYFALASGLSLRKLYLSYKAKERIAPLEAKRIKYLFWAFVLAYTASIDFIQNYGFEFYPTGYLFVSLWVIIVTYAISKYQLMDITFIVTRPKILAYVKPLALIPFYFVVFTLIRLFTGSYQYLLSGILVASFAIFARLLVSLQRQMEMTVEKSFFRKRYDAYQTLTEFTKAIVSMLDLGELTGKITQTLSGEIGIDKVSLFILDEKSDYYIPGSICGLDANVKDMKIKADDPLLKALVKKGEIIIKEELERDLFAKEYQGIVETMKVIEAEVSIPFISKGILVGFCNLGNKKSRNMYTNEDLQLLGNLARQAAIAIENARLHYLEKKSLILMKQIDKVDTFARFAGGMAHEINNPLVTISTFFQLLPQKRDDNEFMDSFASLAFTETERIRRLTRELLDYGKPKEIQFRMEDLNILVTRVVLLIKLEAEKKKIILQSVLTSDLPRIHMDPDQIRQVILNILLNAIDATDEGGSITIETRYIGADQKDEFVQVMIKDTGEGIAKEEIDKIFDPFFTTKHTSMGREGTGLGLSISHQIIKEHKGYINVESTLGKGTTFLIYIPIDPISSEREERPLPIASAVLDTK